MADDNAESSADESSHGPMPALTESSSEEPPRSSRAGPTESSSDDSSGSLQMIRLFFDTYARSTRRWMLQVPLAGILANVDDNHVRSGRWLRRFTV